MLLRHRSQDIDDSPADLAPGLQHLDRSAVAVLRWLGSIGLDYVLVGPVAHAIHGELTAHGPVAVVPAPYARNHGRLAAALTAHEATLRAETASGQPRRDPGELKLTPETLARGRRWLLQVGAHPLDVESSDQEPRSAQGGEGTTGRGGDGARYQELLYESMRVSIAPGIAVEVASLEDLERFSHLRRTGAQPEFKVSRAREGAPGPAHPA